MDSAHVAVKLVPQLIQSYNKVYEGPVHLHPFRLRLPKRRACRSRRIAQDVDVAAGTCSVEQRLPPVLRRPSSVSFD